MPLLNVVIVLIVVGVLLWLVNRFIPMEGTIDPILNAVVVIATILWLLEYFRSLSLDVKFSRRRLIDAPRRTARRQSRRDLQQVLKVFAMEATRMKIFTAIGATALLVVFGTALPALAAGSSGRGETRST